MKGNGEAVSKDQFSNQRAWKGTPVDPEATGDDSLLSARARYESDPQKYNKNGTLRLTPEERKARAKARANKPEWKAKMSVAMKKAHALKPHWKDKHMARKAKAERAARKVAKQALQGKINASLAVQGIIPSPVPAPRNRMIGILIGQIREELHKHIRDGGELTPFHTNVLALTDYLRDHS